MTARPVFRFGYLVAGFALVLSVLPPFVLPPVARAATLPPGFSDSVVLSGLTNPTIVRFASDGRVFVGEKSGLIKVYDSLTDPTPTIFADLRTSVHNYWDRGLLGMALAPNFPTDPSIYVLYTYDALPGGTAPHWGTAGATSDSCPSPPGPTTDGCVVTGRLSRLTASGDVSTGETPLVTDWCQQFPSHSIGTLAFGQDGFLYVSAGDGANFNYADYGQAGGSVGSPTPKNPCGDPPSGVGGVESPPSAEGGSLRSQDLRTPSDPTSLDGAILRLDPSTGLAAPGNPLIGSSDLNARRIVAEGFRNPFRFTFRPGTNELWAGDVGAGDWEEIDRFTPPGSSVLNFGWPCYEGVGQQSGFSSLGLSICTTLYAQGPSAVVPPYYAYAHTAQVVNGESCPTGSSSISGIAFYQGGSYPSNYTGALFFADYSRNCIWVMFKGANGLPDPNQVATLDAGAAGPVELDIGPGGDLFYPDFNGGTVHRISASSTNHPPTAAISATPSSGTAPLTVNFSAAGSSDPDGDTLTYAWDLNGDGQFTDASGVTTSYTYTAAGTYTPAVRVSDGQGGSNTASTTVTVSGGGGPTITYLSSLTALGTPVNGWGPYERDMSNGEQAAGDGHPITLNGTVFSRGLGVHAVSDLVFAVPSGTCTFLASVGVDDEVGNQGSVVFSLKVNGTTSYTSPLLTGSSTTASVNLALPAGSTQLELLVGNGGDNNNYDHADWADARFSCAGSTNHPPTAVIDTPSASLTWVVGQTISFSGHATDAEDGTLPASALSWTLLLFHCPSNCHTHLIQTWSGVSSGSVSAPDHQYPSWLELQLTATDSQGVSTTVTRDIYPQTVNLTFATNPSGLHLGINTVSQTAPVVQTVIIGSMNSITAPSPQTVSGVTYTFSSWSDGGAATHTVVAPSTNKTYTATFSSGGGGPTITYLSSLTALGTPVNGWGPYERDMSNGEQAAGDGHPITLNGTVFSRGLGVHAVSDLVFAVPSGTCTFLASVGVDDEVGNQGSVVFSLKVNGTTSYTSPLLTGSSTTASVNLALPAGSTQLELLVGNGGDNNNYDHADWADARFSCS